MNARRLVVLGAVAIVVACRGAGASGLLLPKDEHLPPLGIKSHRVAAQVRDGVATTMLTEVFVNNTDRRLEATYVFPVPREAALTDFAMYINGKRQGGEIVEAHKARQIYEEIVRRMRDPGLLEYMDSRLLKMRVFPIEPKTTQKIEVSYAYALPFDNGIYRYTFPLRTGEKASKVLEDSTLSVEITSTPAIGNIYSPTHRVGISRKDDHHAVVGFEEEGAMLEKDFVLYFTMAEKDFGLNVLTHRIKGQEGYFALMLAPRVGIEEEDVMPKDVCFLIDTSGSMSQEDRIASAREAVKFCLKSLGKEDRFALLPFSTAVEVFGEGLMAATPENVEKAVAHVEKLEARGGTALCGALVRGLEMVPGQERPYIVVLITDGKPTIGTVEPEDIIEEVKKANKGNVRVFSFGIAESLDVPLLDSIAETTRGYSEYVAPGREIETEIASFFRKVSYPVMSNLQIDFGKVKVTDMYPPELPDLFRGSQVLAFGRYSGSGEVAVRLTGTVKGEKRDFAYDAEFPEAAMENKFISHLWAQRKIAYLLDEIRLHGENQELVDEIVRLSKEYGIATPYTSYLVLEDKDAYVRHGIAPRAAFEAALSAAPSGAETEEGRRLRREAAAALDGTATYFAGAGKAGDADLRTGGRAVELSESLRRWKQSEAAGEGSLGGAAGVQATLKRVGEKTFLQIRGVHVDTEFSDALKTLKVKWGSDAYFALLRAMPELTDYLALGENVILVIEGKALIVGEEGAEELSKAEIKDFLAE